LILRGGLTNHITSSDIHPKALQTTSPLTPQPQPIITYHADDPTDTLNPDLTNLVDLTDPADPTDPVTTANPSDPIDLSDIDPVDPNKPT
jgi:hypothetical protein